MPLVGQESFADGAEALGVVSVDEGADDETELLEMCGLRVDDLPAKGREFPVPRVTIGFTSRRQPCSQPASNAYS